RTPTYPLAHAQRRKPRRLPLVLRLSSGSVHASILLPVLVHSIFTSIIVFIDQRVNNLGLPSTIVPSLSIVVGLMLVFRNGTSYDRFWSGRNHLSTCGTSVRNLTRSILTCARGKGGVDISEEERHDTERVVRILIAVLYAIKHNLRHEWSVTQYRDQVDGDTSGRRSSLHPAGEMLNEPEYKSLLPPRMVGFEDEGLCLPLQLLVIVEGFIKRGHDRGWFHAPQASQLTVQINTLVDAYSKMETIRTTPLPVAHLIHQKQVLALYTLALPFAIVDNYGWYSIPIVALVAFTLYGIDGIGRQLEDPFGYDRNDIKMDGIVEDWRVECMVMLEQWK
ncbi:hypothetical protein EJ05DRAFT_418794, partial [Pseudovirgaria hyperparasitica]